VRQISASYVPVKPACVPWHPRAKRPPGRAPPIPEVESRRGTAAYSGQLDGIELHGAKGRVAAEHSGQNSGINGCAVTKAPVDGHSRKRVAEKLRLIRAKRAKVKK
jgi:hypothetical protein